IPENPKMTMRRHPLAIAFVLGLVVLAASAIALWQSQDAGATTPDRAEGTLGPGQELVLKDGTVLRFVGLVSDSRCPADAMCIQQGGAIVAFALETADATAEFEVAFEGDPTVTTVEGYTITVNAVWPYPLASAPADAADYTVEVA